MWYLNVDILVGDLVRWVFAVAKLMIRSDIRSALIQYVAEFYTAEVPITECRIIH